MSRALAVLPIVLTTLTLSACTTTAVVVRSVRAEAADGLSIAFVEDVPLSSASGDSREVVSCVAEAIRKQLPSLHVVPSEMLLRTFFPSVSTRADALDPLSLMLLRDDALSRGRLKGAGIRYVIALSGGSWSPWVEQGSIPSIAVGAIWMWRSTYSGEIYDTDSGQVMATPSAEADAIGGMGFGIIPPFLYVWPSFTHSRACARLGAAVVEALGGPAAPKD